MQNYKTLLLATYNEKNSILNDCTYKGFNV